MRSVGRPLVFLALALYLAAGCLPPIGPLGEDCRGPGDTACTAGLRPPGYRWECVDRVCVIVEEGDAGTPPYDAGS